MTKNSLEIKKKEVFNFSLKQGTLSFKIIIFICFIIFKKNKFQKKLNALELSIKHLKLTQVMENKNDTYDLVLKILKT